MNEENDFSMKVDSTSISENENISDNRSVSEPCYYYYQIIIILYFWTLLYLFFFGFVGSI